MRQEPWFDKPLEEIFKKQEIRVFCQTMRAEDIQLSLNKRIEEGWHIVIESVKIIEQSTNPVYLHFYCILAREVK